MSNLKKYFRKHSLVFQEILYVYRQDKKTIIHCLDGREEVSLIPVHELYAFLPEEEFENIAKGVIVRCTQIVHISDSGVYTMSDGRSFQGRKRTLHAHKVLREKLDLGVPSVHRAFFPPTGFYEKCSLLDNMPLAYCVIELVFNEEGHGVDFVFRYCNQHMAVIEGIPVSEMLGHSFYEVFKNGDKKWLVTYADVALNGTQRVLRDFSPEINKNLTIYCYQPEPGFCACVLLPEDATQS